MRKAMAFLLVVVVGAGFCAVLAKIPFGADKMNVANRYVREGVRETGAANIVTSVVVTYRGFDTLGEVTVLFIAAAAVGAVLFPAKDPAGEQKEQASLIVRTGSQLLFPLIVLLGGYIFLHGHLTPGGGFQGGAVIASAFLLLYLAWPGRAAGRKAFSAVESLSGLSGQLPASGSSQRSAQRGRDPHYLRGHRAEGRRGTGGRGRPPHGTGVG